MPQTKFQDAVFTAIMATLMVYGMIVYNISLDLGSVSAQSFRLALHELPLMAAIAFVLEFFIVGKLAGKLAFTVVRPTDRPQIITYAISLMILCIMCPTMSLLATLFFQQPSFFAWVKTFALNMPMALIWQMLYCGPFVRLVFRLLFRHQLAAEGPQGLEPTEDMPKAVHS